MFRGSRAARGTPLLAAAVVAGCNPFPSFDGLTGGGADGAIVDGSSEAADAPGTDTTPTDAPPADAPPADAPPCGKEGGLPCFRCPAGAIFCDDFARAATDVLGPWSSESVSPGSTLSIVSAGRGRALRIQVPAGTTGASAALVKNTTVSIASRVTMQLEVFVATTSSESINFNELSFTDTAGSTSLVFPLLLAGPSPTITIGELVCVGYAECAYRQSALVPIAGDSWHELAFTVDFATTPPTITLALDGTPSATLMTCATPADTGVCNDLMPGTLGIQGGAPVVNVPNGAVDLSIANVVVTGS